MNSNIYNINFEDVLNSYHLSWYIRNNDNEHSLFFKLKSFGKIRSDINNCNDILLLHIDYPSFSFEIIQNNNVIRSFMLATLRRIEIDKKKCIRLTIRGGKVLNFVFAYSNDNKIVETLLNEIMLPSFDGFQYGELVYHEGYVELTNQIQQRTKVYFRLMNGRLLCFKDANSMYPSEIYCININTSLEPLEQPSYSIQIIQNKYKNNIYFKLQSENERLKWLSALRLVRENCDKFSVLNIIHNGNITNVKDVSTELMDILEKSTEKASSSSSSSSLDSKYNKHHISNNSNKVKEKRPCTVKLSSKRKQKILLENNNVKQSIGKISLKKPDITKKTFGSKKRQSAIATRRANARKRIPSTRSVDDESAKSLLNWENRSKFVVYDSDGQKSFGQIVANGTDNVAQLRLIIEETLPNVPKQFEFLLGTRVIPIDIEDVLLVSSLGKVKLSFRTIPKQKNNDIFKINNNNNSKSKSKEKIRKSGKHKRDMSLAELLRSQRAGENIKDKLNSKDDINKELHPGRRRSLHTSNSREDLSREMSLVSFLRNVSPSPSIESLNELAGNNDENKLSQEKKLLSLLSFLKSEPEDEHNNNENNDNNLDTKKEDITCIKKDNNLQKSVSIDINESQNSTLKVDLTSAHRRERSRAFVFPLGILKQPKDKNNENNKNDSNMNEISDDEDEKKLNESVNKKSKSPIYDRLSDSKQYFNLLWDNIRDMDCAISSDIPNFDEWIDISKRNSWFRGKNTKRLDEYIKECTLINKRCIHLLRSSLILCCELAIVSTQSNIDFQYPGFEGQQFEIGKFATIRADRLFRYSNLAYSSEHQRQLPTELMLSYPDVTNLYIEGKAIQGKAIMWHSSLNLLHDLQLTQYFNLKGQFLYDNCNFSWLDVCSEIKHDRNKQYMKTWNDWDYIYNIDLNHLSSLITDLDNTNTRLICDPCTWLLLYRWLIGFRLHSLVKMKSALEEWLSQHKTGSRTTRHSVVNHLLIQVNEEFDALQDALSCIPNEADISDVLDMASDQESEISSRKTSIELGDFQLYLPEMHAA